MTIELNEALSAGVEGIDVVAVDPNVIGDDNDCRAVSIRATLNREGGNPQFTNRAALVVASTYKTGQNNYGSDAGGAFTQGKTSFFNLAMSATSYAAGQKFGMSNQLVDYGMGDCFLQTRGLTFAGGPVAGDEGQAYQSASPFQQQRHLALATVVGTPTKAAINTTITQALTPSKNAQTFTVASTTGVVVGDWVIIGHHSPNSSPTEEAMLVTAVGSGTISGKVYGNHSNGSTVKGATRITTDNAQQFFGEQRVVVNLDGASYSTGQVTNISGGGFVGTGTSWTTNMVGGDANNIGAISLDVDTYSAYPFYGSAGASNGPLRSWYQILPAGLTTTALGIHSTSTAGDASYRGPGPVSGVSTTPTNYVVKPAVRVLRLIGNELICEPTTTVWSNGHKIECAICPYPDVSGYISDVSMWTPGGSYRAYHDIRNGGARALDAAFQCRWYSDAQTSNADQFSFNFGFAAYNCNYGLRVAAAVKGAMLLGGGAALSGSETDAGCRIWWHNTGGAYIGPVQANLGALEIRPIPADSQKLQFVHNSIYGGGKHRMRWDADFSCNPGSSVTPTINGEMTFQLTDNTTLVVKVKGSDGTVRSATLTLA